MVKGDKKTFYFYSKMVEFTYALGEFWEKHGGDPLQVESTRNMFVINMYGEAVADQETFNTSEVSLISGTYPDLPLYEERSPLFGNFGMLEITGDQRLNAWTRIPHIELQSILQIVTSGSTVIVILGCEYVGDIYHPDIPAWHVVNLEVKVDVGDVSEAEKHLPVQ